jgi:hypothetical protein
VLNVEIECTLFSAAIAWSLLQLDELGEGSKKRNMEVRLSTALDS